jgi:hypothetical protein
VGFWVKVGLASFAEGVRAERDLARSIVASGAVRTLRHVDARSGLELRLARDGSVDERPLPEDVRARTHRAAAVAGTDVPYEILAAMDFTDVLVPAFAAGGPLEVEAVEVGDLDAFATECEQALAAYRAETLDGAAERERKHFIAVLVRLSEIVELARREHLPVAFRD